jgi:two-component system, LytTR family, response regulator
MRRTIIVDDEPLARRRLRRLLGSHPEVEVIGEAADGPSACALISAERPDLVLLDIQMPGLSGFDVLARLESRPQVIFVTAHDEYAVRAFEEQALDYLLKPVEPARLAKALERLPAHPEPDHRIDRLLEALAGARADAGPIAVRQGSRISLVDPATVCFIRAEDKYAVLYTADRDYVLDRTLDDLEQTLPSPGFVRVHRSAIVNLRFVSDLTALDGGRYEVALTDGRSTRLQASRRGAAVLRDRLRIPS